MPISYEKQLNKHYIHCYMLETGTLDEVLAYVNEIANDPDLDAPFFEIVDFSKVNNLDFGYYQSDYLLSKYTRLGENKGYLGSIFISGGEYGQAIANMFATAGDFKGLHLRIVQSLEEAELLIENYFRDSD